MDIVTEVRVAVATACGRRARNEDAVGVGGWVVTADSAGPLQLVLPVGPGRPALVAVADGMGGAPAGQAAARIAAHRLTGPSVPAGTAAARLLSDVFEAAHAAIRDAGHGPGQGMGCTAGLLVVSAEGTAVVAHVGDVRAYRIVDSYAAQLTEDHRSDPHRPEVSRWLGGTMQAAPRPDIYQIAVRDGDRLVLCSDGIHDALDVATIERAARQLDGSEVAAQLVAAAAAAAHEDNATVAVLDLAGAPAPAPPSDSPAPLPVSEQPVTAPPLPAPVSAPARRPGLLSRLRGSRSRR